MWTILGVCAALLVFFFTHLTYKWRNPKCNGVLPPGNLGWPLIGESLELLIPCNTMDVHPFVKKRIQKYGPIFRTSIAGKRIIVSGDQELNTLLFREDGNLTEMYYLDTMSKLFSMEGENRVSARGVANKFLRALPALHFGIPNLKDGLIPEIESLIVDTLHKWSEKESVEAYNAVTVMLCEITSKKLFSYDPKIHSASQIIEKFGLLADTFVSIPLNIPGTAYYRVMKEKESATKIFKDIIDDRLRSPENSKGDFLDMAISEMKTQQFLTKDFLQEYLYVILFAASESNGLASAFMLYNLLKHPKVLEELEAEHEAFLKKKENPDSPLSWEDYRSMTFSHYVVYESLRLMNVSQGLMRRTLQDVHFKGYTIPAGWPVLLSTSVADHLNPEIFKDPAVFNPWRWKDIDPSLHSKILKNFGEGSRQCAGAEYSKVFQTIFLHVLVTKYKMTKVKGGNVIRKPLLICNDLYINFAKKN